MSGENIVQFPNRGGTPPSYVSPAEIGWALGADGYWHPPGYTGEAVIQLGEPEHIKGPFVLAMQAQMQKLVEEAAAANWKDGYWTGMRRIIPFCGAIFAAGVILGLFL